VVDKYMCVMNGNKVIEKQDLELHFWLKYWWGRWKGCCFDIDFIQKVLFFSPENWDPCKKSGSWEIWKTKWVTEEDKLSQTPLSTQLKSWVWYKNDFRPPPTTQTQCHQYFSCSFSDFNQTLKVGLWNQQQQ